MTAAERLATGCAAALCTAFLNDDRIGFEAMLPDLPPSELILADAALLFHDAAFITLSWAMGRPADAIDMARAWADNHELVIRELDLVHQLDGDGLTEAVDWLGRVLAGEMWIPAHHIDLHLVLCLLFTGQLFAPYEECWADWLIGREMARA